MAYYLMCFIYELISNSNCPFLSDLYNSLLRISKVSSDIGVSVLEFFISIFLHSLGIIEFHPIFHWNFLFHCQKIRFESWTPIKLFVFFIILSLIIFQQLDHVCAKEMWNYTIFLLTKALHILLPHNFHSLTSPLLITAYPAVSLSREYGL